MVCSSHQNGTHVLLLSLTLPPSVPASYSSSEAPPSVGKAPSPAFQVLSGKHHTQLLEMTRNAADRWLAIGIELGFKNNELDDMLPTSRSHFYNKGRYYRDEMYYGDEIYYGDEMCYGDEVCYAAMLRRWLDWAPPNHSPPTLSALVAAMRAVGIEGVAFNLELRGQELTGKCCAVMRFLEVISCYCNDMVQYPILMMRHNICLTSFKYSPSNAMMSVLNEYHAH